MEIAKAQNEIRCARADVEKASSRLAFTLSAVHNSRLAFTLSAVHNLKDRLDKDQ